MSDDLISSMVLVISNLADKTPEDQFVNQMILMHIGAENTLYDRQISSTEAIKLLTEDFRKAYQCYHETGEWSFAPKSKKTNA